jgi:hypothetical protein
VKVALPSPPAEMRLEAVVTARRKQRSQVATLPPARSCSPEASRDLGDRKDDGSAPRVKLVEFDADSIVVARLSAGKVVPPASIRSPTVSW